MAFDLSTARPVEDAPAGGVPPAAPASAGLQIPQQAQQQPRAVGVVETALRTAAMAAGPVVRAIDMAAAGLAGIFGDTQGQAQIFGDMESRSRRMREQYAPAPGEEFSTVGQIGGGVLSMPIEVAGGMGLQRGVARASEVVERGGDLGQASLAGGVTAAANVAANLVPVRLGGAAGRAIEQTAASALQRLAPRLTPGAAATAGRVSGSAATGAGLGVAADVGATIAENSALPGDEAFDDLRRQADPATSAGLGAAFGAWGGRAARAAPAQRAPTPGTQGSAGAAATDMAAQRRARARGLPVPFEGDAALTEGQATRSFEQQRFERETAKDPDTGKPLRERAAAQNATALRNLDALEAFTGAQKTDRGAAGQAIVDAVADKAKRAKREIDDAYGAARDAGDMAEPVDATPLAAWIEENRSSAGNAGVIGTAEAELLRLGGAQKAGDGSLVPRELPINDLEELRKKVVAGGKKDATNAHFAAEINKVIDAATEGRGGDLYKAARAKFRDYQAEFKERGAIRDLIGIKKGTSDRITATEKVLERAMRSADDLKNVRETLISAGDDGAQAWREVQGQAVRKLRDEVTKNVALDDRGNPIVSPAKLKKTIDDWDNDGRLEVLFGKKGAETMRDLRDTAQDLFTAPPGAVNTSNTASVIAKWMADSAASFVATGVPVPLVGLTKAAWKARSDRKVKKQVEQALGPKEPTRPAEPTRNPLEGSDRLPTASAKAAPRGTQAAAADAAAVPADPRLQEIARLKVEQAGSPETIRVLDAQAKRIRAELQAGRAAKTRETEADALERAAGSTFEIAVRQALLARARELRGDNRIPVGEARELSSAPKAKPERADKIPVGEAAEIDVETVQADTAMPAEAQPAAAQLPDAELSAWAGRWGFGALDAQSAKDVREARRYDAQAVERAAQQYARSPVAFGREIGRIIEEGKNRASQAEHPPGGSEGPGGPGGSLRGPDESPGQGGEDGSGGTPVTGGGRPRAPDGPGGGVGQARTDEGVAPAAPAATPARLTDREIVNPIDPAASPADKVRQLERLTEQNKPIVQAFIRELDQALGTRSSDNVKRSDNILAKASRPAILATKPWHSVEHIRDSYRFKSVLGSIEDLPKAIERLRASGVEIVKADVDKVLRSKEFGWRISVFDLRMPNGQLVEYYLPVQELETAKKAVGHKLFEEVRNLDVSQPDQRAKFDELAAQSRKVYQEAWAAYLARTGETEVSVRAALDRAAAAASSSLSNPSRKAAGLLSGEGETQRPSAPRRAEKLPGPNTAAALPPSSATNASTSAIASTSGSIISGRPSGRVTIVTTERGMEVSVRYRVVDAGDLITSNDDSLRVDPRFPAELQPRDRTRQASADQIAKIANGIRPEWMAESPKASDGAPIVGADAVVESGNARTIALRRAYAMGKADHYREWLIENAARFGLTADDVRGVKQPVLVRQGLGDYDRAEFARQANESTVAEMGATERARADAATLPDLEGLQFDEAGNVDAAASSEWIRSYVQTTVGPNKRGEVMTATGELSQTGNTRIRNAVLMKAYNDPALVERVSESLDPGTKNVLNGLSRAAPDVAKLQDMVAAGAREKPTWVPDLVDAVRRFGDAREAGQTVAQYLGQGSLLGGEATPAVATLMQQIEAFSRAPRRLADHVRALARESMKDPRQGELMEPRPTYGAPKKLADDLAGQQQFLDQRAKQAGHASLDDWVAADFEGFMRAAEEWRQSNQADSLHEPEPLLRAQTPADLKAKAGREAAAAAADKLEQQRLANKARADAMRDEFTLTGSDRAADNPGQGSLFEPKPQDPTAPYETDLFGAPVVPQAKRAGPRRGGLQPPAQAGRNVDAAAGLPSAPPGEYATRAALVTTRQQQLGHRGPVRTMADAANALAYLNKSAVERLDALVTDSSGKPLAVIGGFKGALSQATVYPATLLGEAMQIPGAANLWMVHNHPSGTSSLSRADSFLAESVAHAFDGTAIKVRGMIAAGRDVWSGGSDVSRVGRFNEDHSDQPLRPIAGDSVPAQERQLIAHGNLGPPISSPKDAKETVLKLVQRNAYRPTVVLLDAQNRPIAVVPWSVDDAMPLKGNGKLDALLRAVAESNSGAALIGTGGGPTGARALTMDQAQNIGAALAKADVRVLDIIDADGRSAAERGLDTKAAVLRSIGAGAVAFGLGAAASQDTDDERD